MNTIEKQIRQYFAKKEEVAAVYLFGSRAQGLEKPGSDVDVAVLLYHSYLSDAQTLQKQYLAELGRILRKDIHPAVMNHAGELLLKQILSKGKRILVKDHDFEAHFCMAAISRIMDFQPYLSQMQQGMKKKMLEA